MRCCLSEVCKLVMICCYKCWVFYLFIAEHHTLFSVLNNGESRGSREKPGDKYFGAIWSRFYWNRLSVALRQLCLWFILYQLMALCWWSCEVKDWICVCDGLVSSPCSVCLGIGGGKLWTLVATIIVVKLFGADLFTPGVTWTTAWDYGGSWMGWV